MPAAAPAIPPKPRKPAMRAIVWLRDLLGIFSDQTGFGDVTWSGPPGGLVLSQCRLGGEPLSHDLIGRPRLQHTPPTRVVSGVEAMQELFELMMRIDGDGKHLRADAAIEALDHAVGLRRAWLGVAILRCGFGTSLGKSLGEAAAVVCQDMRHAKGKSSGGFTQKGDSACLGLVVLDGEMDPA